jgi:hypothetical protein
MKTLTSIQTLAALAALASAIAVSATPADARGGGRGFGGHTSVHPISFAQAHTARPAAVIAAQIANPGHINTGSTSMIRNTPNGPVFDPHPNRHCIVNCSTTGLNHTQPPAVIAAQNANPGHVNSGSTSMIVNTPNGPVFAPPKQPPAVIAAQNANPGHVNTGSTSMIVNTPNGPVFASGSRLVRCDFNCVKTSMTPNGQIAVARRPVTMSPGPGAVVQPRMQ